VEFTADAGLSGYQGFFYYTGTMSSVTNNGTLRKAASQTGSTSITVTFNNNSAVEVLSGTLALGSSTTGSSSAVATYSVSSGALLNFTSSHTFSSGASLSGAGTARFSGGTITANGITVSCASELTAGTFTATGTNSFTTLTMSGGTLNGTGSVTTSSLLTWSAGTMSGTGSTTANGGLTISTTNSKFLDTRSLTLAAGSGTYTNYGTVYLSNSATFTNNSTLEFTRRRHSAVGFHKPLTPKGFRVFRSSDCAMD